MTTKPSTKSSFDREGHFNEREYLSAGGEIDVNDTRTKKIFPAWSLILSVLLLLFSSCYLPAQEQIKIGYVGNSITQANNHPFWSPPGYQGFSDISALLIEKYFGSVADVQNYGNGGKTLCDQIDPATNDYYGDSYMRQGTFTDALNFAPDICIITLGTNDGRTDFWPDKEGSRHFVLHFYDDYMRMIDSFLLRNPETYFIIGYIPPVFGESWFWVDTMELKVRPEIDRVVETTGYDTIDWYERLLDYGDLFPDKIHPSVEGSAYMGHLAFEKLISTGLLDSIMSKTSLALDKPLSVSSENGSNPGTNATDIDQESYWEPGSTASEWLSVDLGLKYDVELVRLVWDGNYQKDYIVEVSDDQAEWQTLFESSGDTVKKDVHLNLTGAGRYVRLTVNNAYVPSFGIKEFEVYGALHLAGEDLTDLGGSTSGQYTSPSDEGPEYGIDNVPGTKFLTNHKSAWIQYNAPGFYHLNGYTITSGSDGTSRNPVKWVLMGSKDLETWVALDSCGFEQEEYFRLRYQTKRMLVDDTDSYAYFRLYMTSASSILHIGEWELFGDYQSALPPSHAVNLQTDPEDLNVNLSASGTFWEDYKMTIQAGAISNYAFEEWTGSTEDLALLEDPSSDSTVLIMPARDVSYTAKYSLFTLIDGKILEDIKVYPSPSRELLNITGIEDSAILSIYDLQGSCLKVHSGTQIGIAELTSGRYILKVDNKGTISSTIFIKE